jgi:hypothetical protein
VRVRGEHAFARCSSVRFANMLAHQASTLSLLPASRSIRVTQYGCPSAAVENLPKSVDCRTRIEEAGATRWAPRLSARMSAA